MCSKLIASAIDVGTLGMPKNGLANVSTNPTIHTQVKIRAGFWVKRAKSRKITVAIAMNITVLMITATTLIGSLAGPTPMCGSMSLAAKRTNVKNTLCNPCL